MKKEFAVFLSAGFLPAGCASSSQKKLSIIELVPENEKVLVNEKTDIEIKTDPASEKLDPSDFDARKGKIEVDGDTAVFSAEETGTYTIPASKDGIDSNPVTIEIVDSKDDQNSAKPYDQSSDKQSSQSAGSSSDYSTSSGQNSPQSVPDPSAGAAIQKHDTDVQQVGSRLNVDQVMADPDAYVGQQIEVMGYFPQDTPLNAGSPTDANGQPMDAIYDADTRKGIAVDADPKTVDEKAHGSRYVRIAGTFEKKNFGGLNYGITMDDLTVLNPGVPNGEGEYLSPGSPISDLKQTGWITFT